MKKVLLSTIAICTVSLILIGFNDAEAVGYIKFDGIDGEVTDNNHKDWINLLSFQQQIHQSNVGISGATRSRGSVVFGDVVVSKEIDKSSPKLMESVSNGKVFPIVEFELTSKTAPYLKYELKNVMITSYSIGGAGNDIPTEQISLNFEEIKVTYTENDSAGKSKGKVEYSWKVEEGTK